jgi:hypothetical protein
VLLFPAMRPTAGRDDGPDATVDDSGGA